MARLFGPVALVLSMLAACGGSDVDGDDAGTDAAIDAAADVEVPDSTPVDDAGPDADAEVTPIAIALNVLDAEGAGAAGVTVAVRGAAVEPAITDGEGYVALEVSGPGSHLLRLSGEAVLTTLLAVDAEQAAVEPLEVQLLPADAFALLEDVFGVPLDDALGILRVTFEPAVDGGQSAALPTAGGAFVHDTSEAAVAGSTLLAGAKADVFFVDVAAGEAAPTVQGASAEEVCALPTPQPDGWVVEAGALTWGVATCTLVP